MNSIQVIIQNEEFYNSFHFDKEDLNFITLNLFIPEIILILAVKNITESSIA